MHKSLYKTLQEREEIALCNALCLTYRRQQHHGPGMEEHAGPEHGEVLGEAVGALQGAALQRLQTLTAPTPLLQAVVLTHCAEHTHRHTHRTTGDQRQGQVDGERLVRPVQTVGGRSFLLGN